MTNSIDTLLRAELERLRKKDPEGAAKLLSQALGRPVSEANTKRPVGPSYPQRTQHHSPMESESVFVRFAGWFDETTCQSCQNTDRTFDGLYEERAWVRPEDHPASGPRHWLAAAAKPLPELLKSAVAYVRYYHIPFCHKCLGAENWQLAEGYKDGQSVVHAPAVQEQTSRGVVEVSESSTGASS